MSDKAAARFDVSKIPGDLGLPEDVGSGLGPWFKVGHVVPVTFEGFDVEDAQATVTRVGEGVLYIRYLDGIFKGLTGLIRLPRSLWHLTSDQS